MKKIGSQLKRQINNASNISIINNNIERLVLHILLWSFGALVLLYVLLLGNMVSNIVQRRSFEINARALSNEVGNLELTYLSLSNNVDLALSYSMGFKEIKANFATRKSLGLRPLGEPLGSVKNIQNDI